MWLFVRVLVIIRWVLEEGCRCRVMMLVDLLLIDSVGVVCRVFVFLLFIFRDSVMVLKVMGIELKFCSCRVIF